MPQDLEGQIIGILQRKKLGDRPTTLGDLARHFGADVGLIASCARQIVDKGLAEPSMVTIRGARTLHGLLPRRAPGSDSVDSVMADGLEVAAERPVG
jgi:hypothetical protein